MNCQCCGQEFALKKNWIAKKCLCDDEERFISLETQTLHSYYGACEPKIKKILEILLLQI